MTTEALAAQFRMPTPMMDEAERLARLIVARAQLANDGWMVINERRERNPVFDRRRERTTFVFETVRYPAHHPTPQAGEQEEQP